MRNSMADQLLKAGLTNKHKAAKARKAVNHQQKLKDKGKIDETDAEKHAREAKEAKIARDKELNAAQEAERVQREKTAQGRNIIAHAQQAIAEGEQSFHYTQGSTVKTLLLSAEQHRHLSRGLLAIAELDGKAALIPAAAAEKVEQRSPELMMAWHKGEDDTPDEDDPYADYQIPDDLMW
ncbi:MAG: DUF2058 family protein [Granulosicoccaceae bacterium]